MSDVRALAGLHYVIEVLPHHRAYLRILRAMAGLVATWRTE